MITKIKITSGFAEPLPICKQLSKTKLSPGLNILWGANGSGKTTALRVAAAFAFCHKGGWSRLLEPLEITGFINKEPLKLPGALVKTSPGNCKATLTWDKVPVFFANGLDQSSIASLEGTSDDGMGDMMSEILQRKMSPKSSGQTRKFKLNQTFTILQDAPDFKNLKLRKDINSSWQACFQAQADFLAGRPEGGRTTILMDEPEKHLDIHTAHDFWTRVIPHLCKFAQVIIATHHPFALVNTEATWVSTDNEHEKALKTYQEVFKDGN